MLSILQYSKHVDASQLVSIKLVHTIYLGICISASFKVVSDDFLYQYGIKKPKVSRGVTLVKDEHE